MPENRVLILTHEMLPLGSGPASGGGLRVWGIAEGLRARGFDVVVSMPAAYLEGRDDVPDDIRAAAYTTREIPKLLDRYAPDVLVLEQPRELGWYEQLDVPTVIDLPGPVFLENLFHGKPAENEIREKIYALSYGDLFLVSHPRQKPYFLGWLALAGVDLLEERLQVVPFGLPPELPAPAPRDPEPTFVYSGTFHPWQDPTVGLTALIELLDEFGAGQLEIIGGKHPVDIYGEGVYLDPRERLPQSDRVIFTDPLPWDAYNARLRRAWCGINLLAGNLERENAFPIRELNYLWCGLPPIVSPESPFGPEIARAGAGWVCPPHDRDALRAVVAQLIGDRGAAHRDAAAEAARSLIRARYTWDVAIDPLAAFCANPVKRGQRGRTGLVASTDRDELMRMCTELGKVAEAHGHTQGALEQQQQQYAALEAKLDEVAAELTARERALEDSRAAREREVAEAAAALEAERTHKLEVSRRLAGDLEQHRQRIVALEADLNRIRRSYPFRVYRIARRILRPVAAAVAVTLATVAAWLLAPDALRRLAQAAEAYPVGVPLAATTVTLLAVVLVLRLRFRWSWLTPTRARWLGAVKLVALFFLSLTMLVYLKLWERLHRIRVFP